MSGTGQRGEGDEAGERGMRNRPDPPTVANAEVSKTRRRTGWIVIGALAALTGLEFWLSTAVQSALGYLVLTAFAKAALIVRYFMHLGQVWRARGGER